MRTILWRTCTVLALPVLLVTSWWVLSAGSESFFFPPLGEIVGTFVALWTPERWSADVLPSLGRLATGYAVAALAGIGLGVLIGHYDKLRAATEPVLEFLRAIPPPVLVPVIMLFVGVGDGMKAVVIASGCVWPVLLNTVTGVRGVDPVQLDTCAVYRVGAWQRLWRMIVPAASPYIMTGLRQALSIGIILMVIAEMFASRNGLGYAIVHFQRAFAIPEMWSGIILLGLLGVAMSLVFTAFDRWVLSWYHGMRRAEEKRLRIWNHLEPPRAWRCVECPKHTPAVADG